MKTKKEKFKMLHRSFRVAHNHTDIMGPLGAVLRAQATAAMREFTGKWDLPIKGQSWGVYPAKSFRPYIPGFKYRTTLNYRQFVSKLSA